ncbi:hypothetical protein GBA52_014459 [Prunus armeniaca]|nr:hypothetical protein GBA52_014459 [Prunus armeniaca]
MNEKGFELELEATATATTPYGTTNTGKSLSDPDVYFTLGCINVELSNCLYFCRSTRSLYLYRDRICINSVIIGVKWIDTCQQIIRGTRSDMKNKDSGSPPISIGLEREIRPKRIFGAKRVKILNMFYQPHDELQKNLKKCAVVFVRMGRVGLVVIPVHNFFFGVESGKFVERIRFLTFEKVVHQQISWFDI